MEMAYFSVNLKIHSWPAGHVTHKCRARWPHKHSWSWEQRIDPLPDGAAYKWRYTKKRSRLWAIRKGCIFLMSHDYPQSGSFKLDSLSSHRLLLTQQSSGTS